MTVVSTIIRQIWTIDMSDMNDWYVIRITHINFWSISKSTSELQVPSNFWFVSTFDLSRITRINFCRFRKVRQNLVDNRIFNICQITYINFSRFRKVRQNFVDNCTYINFVDFEKYVKTSKFHRIFGLYLISTFVDFKKYVRTSKFHRIFGS